MRISRIRLTPALSKGEGGYKTNTFTQSPLLWSEGLRTPSERGFR
jgi:hypothetical protein